MSIVILGAGLAGLSAAYHLKESCEVFEKEKAPGGLCRSHRHRGFTFDIAGHLLHFKDRRNLAFVKRLLGDNIAGIRRNSWVWSHGAWIRYPFQSHLYGLPQAIARECVEGFRTARRRPRRRPRSFSSFASWAFDTFGRGIARHFLVPYNEKFWHFPLDEMDDAWARQWIPVPSAKDVEEGARKDSKKEIGYNARFWYPKQGGIQALADAFVRGIPGVHTGCEAVKVDLEKKEVSFRDGRRVRFRELISTIPLPELGVLCASLPSELRRALRHLKYVSILNINLGLKKKFDRDMHWIYFPQKEIVFYRLGIASHYCPSLAPQGQSNLYAEISYRAGAPLDKRHALDAVLEGCHKAGFSLGREDIACSETNDIKYAYCVYDRQREIVLRDAQQYLQRRGVFSIGRYGGWRYASMEDVMAEGRATARKILKSTP